MQFCRYFTVIMTCQNAWQFRLQAHENADAGFQQSSFRIILIDSCGSLMRLGVNSSCFASFALAQLNVTHSKSLCCQWHPNTKEHAPAHRDGLLQQRQLHGGRGF